jgi:hypothetical protein
MRVGQKEKVAGFAIAPTFMPLICPSTFTVLEGSQFCCTMIPLNSLRAGALESKEKTCTPALSIPAATSAPEF